MRGDQGGPPGRAVNVIGRVIESYAKRFGYGVVRDFTGHGIGTAFHTGLDRPALRRAAYDDTVIEPGMTFTIEPMLYPGHPRLGHVGRRLDRGHQGPVRRSAQFEHTLLVTDAGAEILTLP